MRLRRPAEPLRMPTESPAASAQVCERVQDKLGFRLPLRGRGHVRVPGRRAMTSPRGWARGSVEQALEMLGPGEFLPGVNRVGWLGEYWLPTVHSPPT